MNTTIDLDIIRIKDLTNDEFDELKKHPYSKKSLEYTRGSEWLDHSLIYDFTRELVLRNKHTLVYKQDNLLSSTEAKDGAFLNAVKNSLPKRYFNGAGFPEHWKLYPLEQETLAILKAIGVPVDVEKEGDWFCEDTGSVVCIVFKDEYNNENN